MGFPKIRGVSLGVPIIRITVFWGLYWDPLWATTISDFGVILGLAFSFGPGKFVFLLYILSEVYRDAGDRGPVAIISDKSGARYDHTC